MADGAETTDEKAAVAMPTVVVGQTFWDYARMEDDDHNLATVTRFVAGREVPDMPVNLSILAKLLSNDGERVRDCIAAKRKREREWKAAQRAKKDAEKLAELSAGQAKVSSGQAPLSAHTNIQEGLPTGRKENKEESIKEEARAIGVKFGDFWTAYPRKVSKQTAQKKFVSILKSVKPDKREGFFGAMMKALESQKRSDQWLRDDGQYIPHPTTWLNQARWEDEIVKTEEERERERRDEFAEMARKSAEAARARVFGPPSPATPQTSTNQGRVG